MWHTMDLIDVAKKLRTNINYGISNEEAKNRLEKYGKNKIENNKKEYFFVKLIKQFNDIMIIILIISAVISAVITKLDGTDDYLDSIIIIGIVLLNALMGTIQEVKAEKAIDALKKLSSPVVKVKREGSILSIPNEEVVIRRFGFIRGRKLCSGRL